MKLLSWNDRGLGRVAKRRQIHGVFGSNSINMASLQKSKLEEVPSTVVASLWPFDSFNCRFSPSIGASGCILTIWDPLCFVLESVEVSRHFVLLQGSSGT
ncbi:hypothetical protein HRI_002674400 [Hibiscus trionum]|uniref:Uncharacterized protein n=1 Tax=Hibiscus trionum TaxID=183268 RepID=A0A9W7M782_HIBTR|nr:hypothetical protein HRI_002674400 [Hibiscus trionum]